MTRRYCGGRFEHGQVIAVGVPPIPVIVIGDHTEPTGESWPIVTSEEAVPAGEDEPEEWGIQAGEAWVLSPHYIHSDTYPPTERTPQ